MKLSARNLTHGLKLKTQKGRQTLSLSKGFTLIELLIVVAIISALAVSVFVALNPSARIIAANDARRSADADSVLSAIHASIVDNNGNLPSNLPAAGQERQIGSGDATACTTALVSGGCNTPAATACANLLIGGQNLAAYLKSLPIDPLGGTTYTSVKTGYSVTQDANGIVTVKACGAQGANDISVSR